MIILFPNRSDMFLFTNHLIELWIHLQVLMLLMLLEWMFSSFVDIFWLLAFWLKISIYLFLYGKILNFYIFYQSLNGKLIIKALKNLNTHTCTHIYERIKNKQEMFLNLSGLIFIKASSKMSHEKILIFSLFCYFIFIGLSRLHVHLTCQVTFMFTICVCKCTIILVYLCRIQMILCVCVCVYLVSSKHYLCLEVCPYVNFGTFLCQQQLC